MELYNLNMELIEFNKKLYPYYQTKGHAAKYAIPYAFQLCKGTGYDIGCKKRSWAFPDSIPIDLIFNDGYHALNLPKKEVDYIFSSHCLEHIDNWVEAMDYWYEILKKGGILFLYLPHYEQEYWRPWNNRKHKHIFTPEIIQDYMIHKGYKNIYASQRDLFHSFMIRINQ